MTTSSRLAWLTGTLCLAWLGSAGAAIGHADNFAPDTVNVIRRFGPTGTFLPTSTTVNGPGVFIASSTGGAIDSAGQPLQWDTPGPSPTTTGTLQITLDSVYSINQFQTAYNDPSYEPANYSIAVSTTGFGSMTTVVNQAPPGQVVNDVLGSPVSAQYIQYTWTGTSTQPYVLLQEFQAFSANPLPTSGGWNLLALGASAPIATTDLTPGKWIDPVSQATDLSQSTYIRGNGTGDAQFLVNLGAQHELDAASLGFYNGQSWSNGAKIEVSADGTRFTTVYDSSSLSSSALNITFPLISGQYLRVTDYGGNGGALTDFQVFASPVPEPSALWLLGLGCVALAAVRRRRGKGGI